MMHEKITRIKNLAIAGAHGKPIVTDVFYKNNFKPKPLVIFCHGYKGFKDWGAWHLVADEFVNRDFVFVKFNFSHNGGTIEQPIDFPDLKSFGQNTYTKELDDLDSVLTYLLHQKEWIQQIDPTNVSLIGHSRGGGMVTLKASEDLRVKNVISWAGISDVGSRFPSGFKLLW